MSKMELGIGVVIWAISVPSSSQRQGPTQEAGKL